MGIGRDTRGAQLVEYLLVVGLVALVALGAFRAFGATAQDKAKQHAHCVATLDCAAEGAGSTASPDDDEPHPGPAPGSDDRSWIAKAIDAVANAVKAAWEAVTGGTSVPKNPTNLELAKQVVKAGGSGTQADVDIVAADLAKLPKGVLQYIKDNGITVIAAKNSITDYKTELKGVKPRGWPPGSTWDSVPGVSSGKEVVIATRNGKVPPSGDGHGSYDLTIHETFHSIDHVGGFSKDPEFAKARDADAANLDAYLKQPGEAGLQEAFAESAAHYFRGDTEWGKKNPNLWKYWETHADKIGPKK